MTLSLIPPAPPPVPVDTARGWAVVEIRPDGTLGTAELVLATEAREAARGVRRARALPRSLMASGALDARLGLVLAASGRLVEAHRAFTRVLDLSPAAAAHHACAGHLALAEACRGDLWSASDRAQQVLSVAGDDGAGAASAHLALAWVGIERDQHEEVTRHLALAACAARADTWTRTVRTVLEARLLLPTRPDSAVQLLAAAGCGNGGTTSHAEDGWAAAALAVARADALLVLGEPNRALATLTPLPRETTVEAGVVVAAARLDIGDVRDSGAVLSSLEERLEVADLSTQLHAWLLEARIAEERGRAGRAAHLVDRVLRCASTEDLRAPVRRQWGWLRLQVERDPASARTHRRFLACFRDDPVAPRDGGGAPGPVMRADEVLGARLTQRETEVLDLLARMYSTDEIAAALYLSSNTVKTHLKGIYAKLCVNRRADAVRRGRQLGLC